MREIEVDPLLLRMVGQRLAPIKKLSRSNIDGFDRLQIASAEVINTKILGGNPIFPASSSGQSLNLSKALAGAIGEALERHGASCRPHKSHFINGEYTELSQKHPLFPLEDTRLFSAEQISSPRFYLKNVAPNDKTDWLQGLLFKESPHEKNSSEIYFPYGRVILGGSSRYPFDFTTTNGLALGSNFRQARETALCESLERAAFLDAWWFKKSPPVYTYEDCLDLLPRPLRVIPQWLKSRLHILDISDTWGIPTFACVIRGLSHDEPSVTVGSASHSSPFKAFSKALEESARIFLMLLNNAEKTEKIPEPPFDESIKNFDDIARLYASEESRKWTDFLIAGRRPGKNALKKQLAMPGVVPTEEALKRGARILAFDITPIDLAMAGLSLARVIVPEAIPLNCAHIARPLGCPALCSYSVAELNPMPHPYL